jgi:Asp-tRNA(Asn)/Glu-tRNA(Gln) amidotransferase A subunit family amidase
VSLTFVLAVQARAETLNLATATVADIEAAYEAGLTAEALTQAYLARISAYDKQGPTINAVIVLNERALAQARTLDAERARGESLVYPTSPTPAQPIVREVDAGGRGGYGSASSFANQTGYPDLIVPAGMTPEGLPVTISFFGQAWSEPTLLGYGYDFEQATEAIRLPRHTPPLAGDILTY